LVCRCAESVGAETTGPRRSRRAALTLVRSNAGRCAWRSRGPPDQLPGSACKHEDVPTELPPDFAGRFDKELGLTFLDVGPDGARAELQIHEKLLQPWGIVHGGVYCSVIESMASISGHLWLSEHGGGTVVGVNNNTDFLRAISSGTVYAVTTPLHRGRRQQLWLTTITDENARVVARGQVRLQNLPRE
jgi:1,4-dihydroxy-2-naphthoyl-CoA hydrolase